MFYDVRVRDTKSGPALEHEHVPALIASVSAVQPTPLSESLGDGGQVGVGKGSDRHVEHRLREEAGH